MIVPDYVERSKRKTLTLTVLKDGRVIVRAPIAVSDKVINGFVEKKQDWIREKLSAVKDTQNRFDDVIKGNKYLIFGNEYSIIKTDTNTISTNNKLEIFVPNKYDDEKLKKNMIIWLKKVAKNALSDRLKFIENRINLKSSKLKITTSRGRWGACNGYGVIHFNWRVVMLPPKIIDYVIVHELCHLVEMNHGKDFWNLVAKYLPNYEICKKEIKGYAFLLNLY